MHPGILAWTHNKAHKTILCAHALGFVFLLELNSFLLSCSIKFNGIGVSSCAEEFTMYKKLAPRVKMTNSLKYLDIVLV